MISQRWSVALLAACLGSGCAGDPTTPSSTGSETATPTTELFVGGLGVGGSRFYSISVTQQGTVSVTLASLVTVAAAKASSATVTLGWGIPAGTGCSLSMAVDAVPALAAQLSTTSAAGTYCVQVSDPGRLGEAMNFVVRIVHP